MSTDPKTEATHDGGEAPAVVCAPLLFSVTKGNPTPEEIAALTVAIAAGAVPAGPQATPTSPTRRERIRRANLRPRHMIAQRRGRA
ncbi:hypothetical protein GCM10027449_12380 [Sinomonas notoginsengisoli]|uniref:acyl-CoA carboxylase subunit epsilon n=1 Tax=Sinomonas notoginsengisoli TaxID=1457311 RepID=UPI001F40B36F|nr:acyl-CoA carboxylase subunit epsilon [Sinomonas notoginsengisoli]